MSLFEHLAELRRRLVRCSVFVCAALVACWFVSDRIYSFLSVPIKTALADARREQMTALRRGLEASLARPCGCYATRVMTSLDPSEIDAYRNTGVFNDSARAKALSAVDECKLKRPI